MSSDREQLETSRAYGLRKRQDDKLAEARKTTAYQLGRQEALEQKDEELAALRALWWFMNDGMGFCDGGEHATLTWAEVTELGDLHDAVEEIYQRDGYPPKPASEIGAKETS